MITKIGFAVTEEGHSYDYAISKAEADKANAVLDANLKYFKKAPIRGILTTIPLHTLLSTLGRNRKAYIAYKHKNKENAYNPFGGWFTSDYYRKLKKD